MTERDSKQRGARVPWEAVRRFWRRPAGKIILALIVALAAAVTYAGSIYTRYSREVDRELAAGPFANTSNIYAAPALLVAGSDLRPAGVAAELRRAGYANSPGSRRGWFSESGKLIEIHPGPGARLSNQAVRVEFDNDGISRIVSVNDGAELDRYELAPQLLANIGQNREKRRLVRFNEIPNVLVAAVLSAEDKRFFEHGGFDSLRMMKAAWVDFREGRKEQGASTITMQLARSLWLDPAKNWRRKIAEMMITAHLEQKLTKQQIFEDYANEVYLGRRGTYNIHGFGEAAREYFGKDIRQLTLPEAALLAGLVQRPGYLNPLRYPERARARRNLVLSLMRQNAYITAAQFREASEAPVQTAPASAHPSDAPYFMDLLSTEIQNDFQDRDQEARDVYTTLDPDLQRDATEAVRAGMDKVDRAIRRKTKSAGLPQVALVAIDPRTAVIRALVGGRDYLSSQLNRALAWRQPGSTFKPFVYAAALSTGLERGRTLFTPATVLDDEPTTFWFNNQPYTPSDFQHESFGEVNLRQALARSVNIISVKLAEQVGYGRVADLAHEAGLETVQATPSAALGAYDITPLDLAGAYTVFSNQGSYVKPSLISTVLGRDGRVIYSHDAAPRRVLDPRVAYLMVSMMQDVLRSGTAASAHLGVPAAGKTGTSRDGWFAGFTSELLCVVWVGYDDGHDLNLEGAKSALPVWTEFMKRALKHPRYADPKPFPAPPGITSALIDPETGELATPACTGMRNEVFIAGTEPQDYCPLHAGAPLMASSPQAPPGAVAAPAAIASAP